VAEGGRPTAYLPEYCDQVVEFGKQGKSVAWIAAELQVHKDTLYEWVKVYPQFSDAFTRARLESQRWWEDFGQQHMLMKPGEGTVNAGMWSRSMAARFPDDWREKQEIEHKGGVTIAATPLDERL
jgi:hypothetical protein